MGIREPQTVVASSAIACFDELDEVSPEVTVQDLVTEKLRWNSPWYRSIPPVRDEDVLLKPLLSRAVVSGLGVYRTVFASYWPVLLVGILQAVVLYVVVHFWVGVKMNHPVGAVFFMMLMAAAFLAITVASLSVSALAARRDRRYTMERLCPPVEV